MNLKSQFLVVRLLLFSPFVSPTVCLMRLLTFKLYPESFHVSVHTERWRRYEGSPPLFYAASRFNNFNLWCLKFLVFVVITFQHTCNYKQDAVSFIEAEQ